MILLFLFILVIALVVANLLIGAAYPKNEENFIKKNYCEEPIEVIEDINKLKENNVFLQGSLNAANKKIDLLSERLVTLEKVTIDLAGNKIDFIEKQ